MISIARDTFHLRNETIFRIDLIGLYYSIFELTMAAVFYDTFSQKSGYVSSAVIMNRKPRLAWEVYLKMETSGESFSLLQLIANDCYKARHVLNNCTDCIDFRGIVETAFFYMYLFPLKVQSTFYRGFMKVMNETIFIILFSVPFSKGWWKAQGRRYCCFNLYFSCANCT